jgi:signal transduction histidine kinase
MSNPKPNSFIPDENPPAFEEILDILAALSVGQYAVPIPDPQNRSPYEDLYAGLLLLRDDLKSYVEQLQKSQLAALNILEDLEIKNRELERLASFPENNPSPVLEVSRHGELNYANKAAAEHFPTLMETGANHPVLLDLHSVLMEFEEESKPYVIRETAIAGKIFQKYISWVPGSEVLRIYVFDITEKKRLEQLKDQFIASVSHEIRTPLTIVKTIIDNLIEGVGGPLNKEHGNLIQIAKNNLDRLNRIIVNVLDSARLESGRSRMNLQSLSPSTLLKELVDTFSHRSEHANIRLSLEAPSDLPSFMADKDMVVQVFSNLVSNALRFAKHFVNIKAHVNPNTLEFVVQDDGPGIPPEHHRSIFNKFEQVQRKSGGSGYKGTGLGLSICKEIMGIHKGRIWVQNVPLPEKGAEFHVEFLLNPHPLKKSK